MVDNIVLIQAANAVLEKLQSMTDEELLKELEAFSKMIEDGFTLRGMKNE